MYELLVDREIDEDNRKYTIIKAGTAAAYSKKSPKILFTRKSKEGDYVDFAERIRKLKQQQEEKKVKMNWGSPPGE